MVGRTGDSRLPQAHWAKIAFEKVFLNSRRRGHPIL